MKIKERINGMIIKEYNAVISCALINNKNRIIRRVRAMLYHNICFGCRARFGSLNPDRTFYVIRCPKSELGFFGLYNYVVGKLRDAVAMNAEPVIDWQYYPNDYLLEDRLVGKTNAWEYFFKPMSGISLSEVYHSQNVIMSDNDGRYEHTLAEVEDADALLESNRLIEKYIILNEETQRICDREYHRLEMDKFSVLGVKLRGTDFKETKPKGHTIAPDGKWLNELFDELDDEEGYKRARMLEYLVSIYLLARCDALIAPVVGATLGAMRIKGQYEHHYLIRLGQY